LRYFFSGVVREQPEAVSRGGGVLGDRAGGLVTPNGRVGNPPPSPAARGAGQGPSALSNRGGDKGGGELSAQETSNILKEISAARAMGEVIV
jgi:hypothetical protein